MLARFCGALFGRAPAAAAGGADLQAIAGKKIDTDFLGAELTRRPSFRQQPIAMRCAVIAAKHAAGTVANALARGVAARGLFGFQHHVEGDAEPATELSVAAGAGAKLVMAEVEWKARLGDLDAAELQAADAVPLADR